MSMFFQAMRVFASVTFLACFAGACSNESQTQSPRPNRASADEVPEAVSVHAAELVSGLAKGHLRETLQVKGFRISKHPTTVGQYRACVDKGACGRPASSAEVCQAATGPTSLDGPTFEQGDPKLPVTCVTAAQAAAFCEWVGGRLPRAAEWMLAARGPKVSRYPWGNDAPNCAAHPDAIEEKSGARCTSTRNFSVGVHKAGASSNGVEDVLLGRGEIIAAESSAPFNACTAPHVACVAYGLGAGAIDAFEAVVIDNNGQEVSSKAATFRCAFGESV